MCRFCGALDTIDIQNKFGRAVYAQDLDNYVELCLRHKDFVLIVTYPSDEDAYVDMPVPINFCPFCGRDFQKWKADGIG